MSCLSISALEIINQLVFRKEKNHTSKHDCKVTFFMGLYKISLYLLVHKNFKQLTMFFSYNFKNETHKEEKDAYSN